MEISSFSEFIASVTKEFTPVVDSKYQKEEYVFIDLSEDNQVLKQIELDSSELFEKFIDAFISQSGGSVAYGGYNEIRQLYRRSEIFNNEDASPRNIHIGLDIWSAAGTKVIAPLDGTIHSFQDNDRFGDYGPTIIMEHSWNDVTFYTLYGHLSKKSIEKLSFGQIIEAGDTIAKLGANKENGDYAPHLHFQIIKDLQGYSGDYPGVTSKEDAAMHLENCPDPNLLLKIT